MSWRDKLRGFYAVLDAPDETLARTLVDHSGPGAAATVLQVRYKPAPAVSTSEVVAIAQMARRITRRAGTLLIVDDRIDIALAAGADGVHLGQEDLPLAAARCLADEMGLARRFLIGVSTHDTAQIADAVAGGADYLGFGPVFATSTKDNPYPVQGVEGLARAVELAGDTPVVAIGGITPERAAEVASTGAAAACAIGAVNGAADVGAAGRGIGAAWR